MDAADASLRRSRFGVRPAGEATYDLVGELDISTAGVLQAVLEHDPAPRLTFDATGLQFLDSSGMRVLLRAIVSGRAIVLRSPGPTVLRTIRMAGVDRLPGFSVES